MDDVADSCWPWPVCPSQSTKRSSVCVRQEGHYLLVLRPSSATQHLQAGVFRRRLLTIVLPLHRLGELLHFTL